MDNHTNLDTLTAKMDALRAKGFNDDEINQLLAGGASTPAVKTEEDKEYIEQWNERVDSVHKYEWLAGCVVALFVLPLFVFDLSTQAAYTLIISGVVLMAAFAFFQTSRIKEFFKKRP